MKDMNKKVATTKVLMNDEQLDKVNGAGLDETIANIIGKKAGEFVRNLFKKL